MDSPERDYAQVGDTIEITYEKKTWLGRQFVVIPPPEKINSNPQPGDAWISNELDSGSPGFIRFCNYKVIKRAQETGSVDVSLRKQLNNNLKSVFC